MSFIREYVIRSILYWRILCSLPGGLVMIGVLSLTGSMETMTVAVPVRGGEALSMAST